MAKEAVVTIDGQAVSVWIHSHGHCVMLSFGRAEKTIVFEHVDAGELGKQLVAASKRGAAIFDDLAQKEINRLRALGCDIPEVPEDTIYYDTNSDVLHVRLPNASIFGSRSVDDSVILNADLVGNVVGLQLMRAHEMTAARWRDRSHLEEIPEALLDAVAQWLVTAAPEAQAAAKNGVV